MRYKNVLLDLDNTLYDTRQTEKRAMSAFLEHYAPSDDAARLYTVYKQINLQFWQKLETGEVEIGEINQERFRRFFTQENISADPQKAGEYYLNLLCQFRIFYPQAEEIYEYLTKKYQVALITNGLKAAQERRIRNTFLNEEISALYIGEVIGYHKPAPEVIDHIMTKENWADKKQVIIIGDSLSSDIQCAQNAGISSIWCNFTGEEPGRYKPEFTVTELLEIKKIL
ncbi:MAG: YjjG family noncanonical pyrimidine nucleotidase [Candidatus Cloacimonetes bacterium]|nr:YjjG family noncanonical pyrimidine nucleotidase [Candidatus Cloacimonadota bacterium]